MPNLPPDQNRTAYAIVTTTVAQSDEASRIARKLVEDGYAACVQILQIGSVYTWKGAVEEAPEHMLICKIRAEDYGAVEDAILDIHSYETPEIIATPVTNGFQPYLDWIAASTIRDPDQDKPD